MDDLYKKIKNDIGDFLSNHQDVRPSVLLMFFLRIFTDDHTIEVETKKELMDLIDFWAKEEREHMLKCRMVEHRAMLRAIIKSNPIR